MTRSFGIVAIALVLFLIVACGDSLTAANADKVKVGMTEKEVHAILGKPTRSEAAGGIDVPGVLKASGSVQVWESGEKSMAVTFGDGKVLMVGPRKGF